PPPLTSCPPPSCPCPPWRPAKPASPWRCGWPHCWGRRPAGSPAHSAGTRGPASHRSHPPPAGRQCPWLCCCPPQLPPPVRTLQESPKLAICSSSVMLLRSGSPARPNSCWVMVIFSRASSSPSPPEAAIPASAAEAAAALLASSSCRCLCSSMETRRACRDGDRAVLSGENPGIGRAGHTLPPRPTHQGQLWVGTWIHAELEVAGAEAQHGPPLTSQDGGADEGISQAGSRRHRHQMGARAILAIQSVDEGSQFVCVGFLGVKRGAGSPAPPMLPTHLAASLAAPLQEMP
uniref:Uncharacterized protein n=1 Tax=Phasianus colchicus TaxID=9054 RepID=A0A669QI80_PHACC